ncbi:MAG: LPS export ABC transporter ATP-binding protein [Legionellales bacterium]|nr:LPS export ABC transporter ATP-binding protein [Legionellales bacterium]OUX68297.1 MAG: LPS export ABC transporter ATP-binding protein [bacterium TMED178]|tara:strand:- start:6311 stop:7051 length:741 start_codon:yes stop_codon:yes gene_type:complete
MSIELRCENLSFSVKNRHIVSNVSISARQGEVVGIFGPNGAGKTTTFHMIAGIISCSSGRMFFNDEDITRLALCNRAKLGLFYLPQDSSIFKELSVYDNILGAIECRKDLSRANKIAKVEEILELIGLTKIAKSAGKSVSGGERRRIEIARLLALSPKMIMLDEPFAGVDPIAVNDIKAIIKKMADSNVGIVITDHNVRETLTLCCRGYVLHDGKVISSGKPKTIIKCPKVSEVYLADTFSDIINS